MLNARKTYRMRHFFLFLTMAGALVGLNMPVSAQVSLDQLITQPQDDAQPGQMAIVAAAFNQALPLDVGDNSSIVSARPAGFAAIEMTVQSSDRSGRNNGPIRGGESIARTAMRYLCTTDGEAIKQLLQMHIGIYLQIPAAVNGPARFKVNEDACQPNATGVREVATPLPSSFEPALIRYHDDRIPVSYASCTQWEADLSPARANNQWVMDYTPAEMVKDEFETTTAFQQRVGNAPSQYVNLTFPIPQDGLRYSADTLTMTADFSRDLILATDLIQSDQYVGNNAFGATANITRTRERKHRIIFHNARAVLPDTRYFSMETAPAPTLKEDGVIHVLGRVIGHYESYLDIAPTLTHPTDRRVVYKDTMVEPLCVAVRAGDQPIANWQER